MDYNIQKEEYEKLRKLVEFLKLEFQNRINDIDEIYNVMIDNCSLDEIPFYSSILNECKNSVLEIVDNLNGPINQTLDERITEINNMISY